MKNKSPIWHPIMLKYNQNTGEFFYNIKNKCLSSWLKKIDPKAPEIVFFGLILVNFGPLKVLPTR